MSDHREAPDWWRSPDGKWHAPEESPPLPSNKAGHGCLLVGLGLLLWAIVATIMGDNKEAATAPSPRSSTSLTVPTGFYEALARSKCGDVYADPAVKRVIDGGGEVAIDFAGDNYIQGFTESAGSPRDPVLLGRMEAACEAALREAAGLQEPPN